MTARDAAGPHWRSLTVVTPWYPSSNHLFSGTFVRNATRAVAERFTHVTVFHTEDWPLAAPPHVTPAIRSALRSLLPRASVSQPDPEIGASTVVRLPALAPRRQRYAARARAHAEALRAVLPAGLLEASIIHAHVGIPTGWAASTLAAPDVPVFVTEHATFLRKILAEPAARDLYEQLLERCSRMFCVSEVLVADLVASFPHHTEKFTVVPNAVHIPLSAGPHQDRRQLSRWLYVGRITPEKGVLRLLESFACCSRDDPRLTLTMVGSGRLTPTVLERALQLGVKDRLRLVGPLSPEDIFDCYRSHDLLVHLSEYETFGMTVVEAVCAGLPVLVTRCGGPDETLAGISHLVGATVDVADTTDDVVAAYRALADRIDELDLDEARRVLAARYSLDSVGSTITQHYEQFAVEVAHP